MILTTEKLKKSFSSKKGSVESVKNVSIEVQKGEIFGFIGPNGAGKTTTMRMLTTLLEPTGGKAQIVGYDLMKEPHKIRQKIGYVSQVGGLDTHISARDNLIFQTQLYGASKAQARIRTDELIQAFNLESFADRPVHTYSGGQRRRVDIALALVHHPSLLFLDEPTTGLDPQSRAHLWQELKKVQTQGTTLFLTTHYLDEADVLCDKIAIIDNGTIVTQGTPQALKREIAGDIVTISCATASYKDMQELVQNQSFVREVNKSSEGLRISVNEGETALMHLVRLFDTAHVPVASISLSRPTLDDVFLKQTGRSLRETNL